MKIIEHTIDDIEIIPKSLFKYYKFDTKYNKKRLKGEVFFSSPLKFNDPFDSQLDVENNHEKFTDEWLFKKLFELGYEEIEIKSKIKDLRKANKGDNVVIEIQKKQLENCGILCLSENYISPLMWAYYTNNEGYCIEYDTKNILQDIIVGFLDEIPPYLIDHLINRKNYCEQKRDYKDKPERTKNADNLFSNFNFRNIKNNKLIDMSKDELLYFAQNLYVKRLWGRNVEYTNDLGSVVPTLFMDKNNPIVNKKYYTKLTSWQHEKEYRLILSLGGNKSIKIPSKTIKRVILGSNISNENICSLLSILNSENSQENISICQIIIRNNDFDISALDLSDMLEKYNKLIKSFKGL